MFLERHSKMPWSPIAPSPSTSTGASSEARVPRPGGAPGVPGGNFASRRCSEVPQYCHPHRPRMESEFLGPWGTRSFGELVARSESCCQDIQESAEHPADATKSQVGALAALASGRTAGQDCTVRATPQPCLAELRRGLDGESAHQGLLCRSPGRVRCA